MKKISISIWMYILLCSLFIFSFRMIGLEEIILIVLPILLFLLFTKESEPQILISVSSFFAVYQFWIIEKNYYLIGILLLIILGIRGIYNFLVKRNKIVLHYIDLTIIGVGVIIWIIILMVRLFSYPRYFSFWEQTNLLFLLVFYLFLKMNNNLLDYNKINKKITILTISIVILLKIATVTIASHIYHLAKKCVNNKNNELAISKLRLAVSLEPTSKKILLMLGNMLLADGKYSLAAKSYETYLNLNNTKDERTVYNLKVSYLRMGKIREALFINTQDFGSLLFSERYQLAVEAEKNNLFEYAVHELQESQPTTAEDYYKRGILFYKLGVWRNALNDFLQAEKLGIKSREIFLKKGGCYSEINSWKNAKSNFLQAGNEIKKYIDLFTKLGDSYHLSGDTYKALAIYEEIFKINPGYTYLNVPLDKVYLELGDKNRAQQYVFQRNSHITKLIDKTKWQGTTYDYYLVSNGKVYCDVFLPESKYSLWINASGTLAKNVWPVMIVEVDNKSVGEYYVAASQFKLYHLALNVTPGKHQIAIRFVNDFFDTVEDRNLRVGDVLCLK